MNLLKSKNGLYIIVSALAIIASSQLLASCAMTNSGSQAESTNDAQATADTAAADANNGAVEMLPSNGDPQPPVTTAETPPTAPVEAIPETKAAALAVPETKPPVMSSGELADYKVKKGDTLMSIAFNVYGDVMMWKSLYDTNKETIKSANALTPGMGIKYQRPASDPVIERAGEQYKIKKGDTLGTIAYDIYGKTQKWKKIWENNKTLIKDPNKIYAGFYVYYQISEAEKAEAEQLKSQGAPSQLGSAEKIKPAVTAKKDQQTSIGTATTPAAQGLNGLQNLMQRAPASVQAK